MLHVHVHVRANFSDGMDLRQRNKTELNSKDSTLTDVENLESEVARDVRHDDQDMTHEERMDYLQQKPFWRRFLNVNAVIMMTVTAFLYGFFY